MVNIPKGTFFLPESGTTSARSCAGNFLRPELLKTYRMLKVPQNHAVRGRSLFGAFEGDKEFYLRSFWEILTLKPK